MQKAINVRFPEKFTFFNFFCIDYFFLCYYMEISKLQSRQIRCIRFSELICTFTVRMKHKIKTILFFLAFYALILTSIAEAKSRFYFPVFFESEKLST